MRTKTSDRSKVLPRRHCSPFPGTAERTQNSTFAATFLLPGFRHSLWRLPRCKGKLKLWRLVGCSSLFGLLVQPLKTAGPDGVRELSPIWFNRL